MYLTPLTPATCKMVINPLVVAVLCKTHADWMAWVDREYCIGDILSLNKTTLTTTDGMRFLAFIWSGEPDKYRGHKLDSYQFANEDAPEDQVISRMCATERGKALWEIVCLSVRDPVPVPVEVAREYDLSSLGWRVKYSDGTESFEKDIDFLHRGHNEYRLRYADEMGKHTAQKRDRYIMDMLLKEGNDGQGKQKTPHKRRKVRR